MHRRAFTLTALVLLATLALAQKKSDQKDIAYKETAPDVPDAIQAPQGLNPILFVHAKGTQNYTCQADPDGKYEWTLKGPDAELRDRNDKVIGQHTTGPKWTLKDGSDVTAKTAAHVDSLDSDSIPWLLLNVVSNSGRGQLAKVNAIQRVHTHGGKPGKDPCDESHKDTESKTPYTADYYFFAPVQ